MIQDAVTAGLLPKQPLETRLAAVIETATSTDLGALDNEVKATRKLYVQKVAQAADEAWPHTIGGFPGPSAQTRQSNITAPPLKKKTERAAAPSAAFTAH